MNAQQLSVVQFEKVAGIIYHYCGINLEPCKKVMVESRLNKRLRTLNIPSFEKYIQFVVSKEGSEAELVHMIDVVTTNKTDFFREPHHFDFLINSLLPQALARDENNRLRIWSAACSSGEEPYTIAMVLQEFAQMHPNFTYEIVASDISTSVLQKASDAIYQADRAEDIPAKYRQKYLLKSKDNSNPRIRIVRQLREKVKFCRINLTDMDFKMDHQYDAIFCRNVLIYFDRETQFKVIDSILKKLRKGGLLFIGHSESLHFFELPIKQIKPTIFIKS